MGRQSNRNRSTSAEREFPGCISGVFQNLFDFNQGFPSRKLLQDVTLREGLEAPRNSLDIPRGTLDLGRRSEASINDIPFGFEFPKEVAKWKVQVEDGPGAGPVPRKFTAEDGQKPSSPRPNVVARLMGLELMPDKATDASVDRSRRNSVSGDGKQFFGISVDRQHKQEQKNSRIQYRSSSFREVHPQEKQLEEFKREFVAHRALQCRDYCQYEVVAEEQSNRKLKTKRYVGCHDQILSKAKYIESTEARPVRRERVEESLNVLQDRNSLQTKHADTRQGGFHGKSRPPSPFFDEVAPFRDRQKFKVLPVPLNNNSNGKSSSSVVMPSKTDVKSSSASSEDFRVSRRSPPSEFLPSKNSKENHKVVKSMRFSKEDVFSPKEIAKKMVKQAKENNLCRAAREVFVNHDLAFSPSFSTFRRRNLQKGESTGAAAVEVESPTLRRLVSSGKSSPRQVISPRLNKSTDEIYRDDGSNSKYENCSHNNSNSNSPRVQVSSSPSKCKPSNGNKMERDRFHGKVITSYDFGTGSQRMFSPFTSHSPSNILHGRFPSSNTKKTDYDNYCSISKGKTITKMKTMNSACNFVEVAQRAKLHSDNLAYSAAEKTETVPSCTTGVKRPDLYHAKCPSPSISSPRSREFVYNKKKIPQPISGEICSMDKTLNKGRQGEVGWGWGCTSFLDEKRDQPSPVSVLEGNSSLESPSRLDHTDATTHLQELGSRLCLLKENKEEDLSASGNQVMNAGDKVANQNHLNESLTVEDIICPEESKSDLVYVRNILYFAGFKNQSMVTFTKWYSPAHPINPDIFLQLEKYYSEVKPPSPTDNLARKFSNHRKLLFELVDEILCKKVKPLLNIRPWINPRKLNGRNYMISSGKELLKDLWSEICSFPQADCRTLEDVEGLVKGDLGGIDDSAPPTDEDVEKIGFEVEQHIFNTLIEDAVADLFFAL